MPVRTLPLRALAERCGLSIGTACEPRLIESEPRYAETLAAVRQGLTGW